LPLLHFHHTNAIDVKSRYDFCQQRTSSLLHFTNLFRYHLPRDSANHRRRTGEPSVRLLENLTHRTQRIVFCSLCLSAWTTLSPTCESRESYRTRYIRVTHLDQIVTHSLGDLPFQGLISARRQITNYACPLYHHCSIHHTSHRPTTYQSLCQPLRCRLKQQTWRRIRTAASTTSMYVQWQTLTTPFGDETVLISNENKCRGQGLPQASY
jgi:hypothetical protein